MDGERVAHTVPLWEEDDIVYAICVLLQGVGRDG